MLEALTYATAIVIGVAGLIGYRRTRDPLSPMVVFAPMLLFVYAYRPLVLLQSGALERDFPDLSQLEIVHFLNLAAVSAFCLGCIWEQRGAGNFDRAFAFAGWRLLPSRRTRLFQVAIVLGAISNAVFWSSIWYSGGPLQVFSQAKPFLSSPIASGYFSELPILSYPALLLLAAAWQGQRPSLHRILLVIAIASPHLVMGTFGGRRGPAFLIVCTLVACWCIARSRRPNLRLTLAGLAMVGILLLLLEGNRGSLFKPWSKEADFTALNQRLSGADVSEGDEYVSGSAVVLAALKHKRYYWGRRYFTTYFVRPIPRQLWPTKYQDVGMEWMGVRPGSAGFSKSEWYEAVGFETAGGSAGGFISDLFLEFSFGAVFVCFLIGRFYSWVWKRWTTYGGFWTLLYISMLALSVYLPSQSVGAWLYRLLLVGVPCWLVWYKVIAPRSGRPYQPASRNYRLDPRVS